MGNVNVYRPFMHPANPMQTVELAGGGGTVSNGALEIGGVEWTAYGVGSSNAPGVRVALADLIPGWKPYGVIEAVICWSAYTTVAKTGLHLMRYDDTLTYRDGALIYRDGAGSFVQAKSNFDGSETISQVGISNTYANAGGRMGGVMGRGFGMATCDDSTDQAAIHPMSLAATTFQGVVDRSATAADIYAADDVLVLEFNKYTAGAVTCAITQNASGLTLTNDTGSIVLTHLHLRGGY